MKMHVCAHSKHLLLIIFLLLPVHVAVAPFTMSHPIHMHGHHFHVVKVAYPSYNRTTGFIDVDNPDIRCDSPACNSPTWADPTWRGDNIPGLNLRNPPLKDTVLVPSGGYVVIRITADNPGTLD
jgi:FtsP/CotA-like multicopper oxidase with cupredoxin domain